MYFLIANVVVTVPFVIFRSRNQKDTTIQNVSNSGNTKQNIIQIRILQALVKNAL